MKNWRYARLVCTATICVCVLACIAIAVSRSNGLISVTVTSLGEEPTDRVFPLFKRDEALPDYELSLVADDGSERYLGTKPNTSAVNGLTWTLNETVPVSQIASIRLTERDKVVSDAVAEVHILGDSATANDYRFDFVCARSFSVGLSAFFRTPIGIAVCIAVCIPILYVISSNLFGIFSNL